MLACVLGAKLGASGGTASTPKHRVISIPRTFLFIEGILWPLKATEYTSHCGMMLESFLPRPDFPFLVCLSDSSPAPSAVSACFSVWTVSVLFLFHISTQMSQPPKAGQCLLCPAPSFSHWTCMDTHSMVYSRFLNLIVVSSSNLLSPFVKAETTVPVDY